MRKILFVSLAVLAVAAGCSTDDDGGRNWRSLLGKTFTVDSTTYVVVDSEIVHVRRLLTLESTGSAAAWEALWHGDTVCSEA